MKYILRLFPEISIKSRPVRNYLTKMVCRNLLNVAGRHGLKVNARWEWDKVLAEFVDATAEQAATELSRLPGVHSFTAVHAYPFETLEDLYEAVHPRSGPAITGRRFCVRVRRHGQHPFNSQQAERYLGARFAEDYKPAGVDLDAPEVTIRLTLDRQTAYLEGERQPGLGGFPVGSQGRVLALVSGGFDSGVAAYLALRRGCRVDYLFFNLGGLEHELGVMRECRMLWERFGASHRVRFVAVPFEETVGQILERTHHGVRGVLLKRAMMRVGALDRKSVV